MESEVKLCPFCAEEIKAAAIVCKHCGRDLPGSNLDKVRHQRTPWKAGERWGIAAAILTIPALMYNNYIPATRGFNLDLLDFLLGPLINFFVFTAIAALLIWTWREIGYGLFIILGIIVVILYLQFFYLSTSY